MSNRERRRELIFGILYTLFGSLMLIGGIAGELSQLLITGFVFLLIGDASWIKLAVHKPSKPGKDRPIKQNAAHMAREAELAEQKRQQELAHETRKQSYRDNPVPLQIRQWTKASLWDWEYKRHAMSQTLYIQTAGTDSMSIFRLSISYKDCCVIQQKDGIWYLCPLTHNVRVRMNSQSAREKCPGFPVNPQEFTVIRGQEQELLPGDCFVVTQGSAVEYFRVEKLTNP